MARAPSAIVRLLRSNRLRREAPGAIMSTKMPRERSLSRVNPLVRYQARSRRVEGAKLQLQHLTSPCINPRTRLCSTAAHTAGSSISGRPRTHDTLYQADNEQNTIKMFTCACESKSQPRSATFTVCVDAAPIRARRTQTNASL
jgi:hypothetical protein